MFDVETPWWSEVETIVSAARARFGVDLFVLRVGDVDGGKFMCNGLVTYTAEVTGAHSALPALERGELDLVISGMTITPDRNARVAFAGP